MDKLVLKTDDKMRKRSDLISLSILGVIMTGILLFFTYSRGLGAFFATEGIMLAALAFTYFKSANNGSVTLTFEGDSMVVSYADGRKYNVSDVDRSFFTLIQTEKQKKLDVGTLSVQTTNFKVQYIKDFDSLRKYINTHFEKKEKKSIYYFDPDDEE